MQYYTINTPEAHLTVTSQALKYQFLIQWKEVRHRRTVPRDKEEWNAAQAKTAEREGEMLEHVVEEVNK